MKEILSKIKNWFTNCCSKFVGWLKPRKSFRWIFTFSLFVLFIVYLVGGIYFAVKVYRDHADDNLTVVATKFYPLPAAVVGGRIIWTSEYYWNIGFIKKYSQKTTQPLVDDRGFRNKILDRLIDDKIMELQALKYGVRVTSGDINSAYDNIVNQANGPSGLKKVLGDFYGMSESEFKRGLLRTYVLKEKIGNEIITQVKVSHILMKDEGKAKEVFEKAKKGEDFAALAKQYSEDVKSRDNGGQLDWFARGELMTGEKNATAFEEAAFNAKTNEITGPVKTDTGFEIFKVTDKKGKVDSSFNDWVAKNKAQTKNWRFILN